MKLILMMAFLAMVPMAYGQNTCTVEITGMKSSKGKCLIYLYKGKKGFPTDTQYATNIVSAEIQNGKCTATIKPIANGAYAIAVIHDENGNGKMDTNFLGMPKEGIGTSNNAKSSFGPPSFDDSTFKMEGKPLQLQITIKYL